MAEKPKKKTKKAPEKKEKIRLTALERKHSKKYRTAAGLVEAQKLYEAPAAIDLAKKTTITKFDSSIEVHIRLGVDPSAADQQVRSTVVLPEGTGISKRIAVLCGSSDAAKAKEAGADLVGTDELIVEIEKGKINFDVLVATPEMMPKIGKLGRILGTKGLMPNPKSGTVSGDPAKTVKELKTGKIEFKIDKNGIIHQAIGKASFTNEKLQKNYDALIEAVKKVKPQTVKGNYLISITIASTMGPGIKIAL